MRRSEAARRVPGALKPHIACPTTAGTGSETTGIAIFNMTEINAKTGIISRRMIPTIALIDPTVTSTLPGKVVAASGFDCMSHALESLTARPWPRRLNPARGASRPVSQGANPFSDALAGEALKSVGKFLVRAVNDASDVEARTEMMYAATQAGIAFNAAGCHLPHGLSYSVSGLTRVISRRRISGGQVTGAARHGGGAQQPVGLALHRALLSASAICAAQHVWVPKRAAHRRRTRAKLWQAASSR